MDDVTVKLSGFRRIYTTVHDNISITVSIPMFSWSEVTILVFKSVYL